MTEETIKTIDTRAELASSFVGFMVHYVLPRGFHKGEIRPAIIVKAWSETCCKRF